MKLVRILTVALALFAFSACQEKSAVEKAEDAVNDALDRRPAEGVQDAVEEASDAAQEAAKKAEEVAKEAARKAAEATQ
ncbi:MAG: hypothetical protein FJ108_07045 [Deltaproteobacteria bacterium]|nr:hypothetical protein [Deltaproteobacteria bacterium]